MNQSSSSQKRSFNTLTLLPKLFLIIAIILLMWIVIVFSGVSVLEYDYDWAGLSLSAWLLIISILFGVFIIIDILMYVSPSFFIKNNIEMFSTDNEPSEEYLDGMKVYEYSYPTNKKGGIFSKTYIKIDENTLLRMRNHMISAETLWPKKKAKKEN